MPFHITQQIFGSIPGIWAALLWFVITFNDNRFVSLTQWRTLFSMFVIMVVYKYLHICIYIFLVVSQYENSSSLFTIFHISNNSTLFVKYSGTLHLHKYNLHIVAFIIVDNNFIEFQLPLSLLFDCLGTGDFDWVPSLTYTATRHCFQ